MAYENGPILFSGLILGNISTPEAEAEGLRVWQKPGLLTYEIQGQPELHSETLSQTKGLWL
jgi:hypothetical protein